MTTTEPKSEIEAKDLLAEEMGQWCKEESLRRERIYIEKELEKLRRLEIEKESVDYIIDTS